MIALDAERTLRVEHAGVLEIECLQGVLWVTRPGDPCDRFLGPGETLRPSARGVTLVTAIERSLVNMVERPARRPLFGWLSWLHRRPVVRSQVARTAAGMTSC